MQGSGFPPNAVLLINVIFLRTDLTTMATDLYDANYETTADGSGNLDYYIEMPEELGKEINVNEVPTVTILEVSGGGPDEEG